MERVRSRISDLKGFEMQSCLLLIRKNLETTSGRQQVVESLDKGTSVITIDLESVGDDDETWEGIVTQILESDRCICI